MTTQNITEFSSLALRAELTQALAAVNYTVMTPVQSATAAAILDGRDLLAQAETGSGKTAAFAIGILNKLAISEFTTQALVICPTRELSEQVATEIRRLASALANTRVVTLCGGKPMHDQLTALKREPHVVTGTPGRLKNHIDKGSLRLESVQTLVLDEADRMLDMGFKDDIMHILDSIGTERQTLLFSATYPSDIVGISRVIQNNPVTVKIQADNAAEQIDQYFFFASDEQKTDSLYRALGRYQPESAIIFCNRKQQVQVLCNALRLKGIQARALHGDLEQRERDEAILLFANRSISLLVATDVAARGLDISALSVVINYDLSPDPETHLHRIGRTGRAGLNGIAISFVTPDEMHRVRAIEHLMKTQLAFGELHASDQDSELCVKPQTRTIHISAGKKDKIRPGDIVGALTSNSELSSDDIGKITVQAKVAFAAIAYDKARIALKILSEGRIKKQKVRVRLIG